MSRWVPTSVYISWCPISIRLPQGAPWWVLLRKIGKQKQRWTDPWTPMLVGCKGSHSYGELILPTLFGMRMHDSIEHAMLLPIGRYNGNMCLLQNMTVKVKFYLNHYFLFSELNQTIWKVNTQNENELNVENKIRTKKTRSQSLKNHVSLSWTWTFGPFCRSLKCAALLTEICCSHSAAVSCIRNQTIQSSILDTL